MKKILTLVLALSMVLALCAGCGGNKNEPAAPTAAPTDLPSVTAPPVGTSGSTGLNTANDDTAPVAQPGQGPDLTSEGARTAYSLCGHDVSELYNAIGQPSKAEYSASCIAPDAGAEDGLLYYDGFTVSTVRMPDGKETVQGVF